ncbi:uncharacterized protein [Diadema antillarum]|uniref:uncharacterized protein n=1 Tax=Diadema antillarum TaxID=105358 RepID=UPI003A8B53E6
MLDEYSMSTKTETGPGERDYVEEDSCEGRVQMWWILLNLFPAMVLVMLATFCRFQTGPCKWQRRPRLAYPVNLLDGYSNRLAYLLVFVIMSNVVINMVIFGAGGKEIFVGLSAPMQFILSALVKYITVIMLGLLFYPLLLCITYNNVFTDVCGFLYTCDWSVMHIHHYLACTDSRHPMSRKLRWKSKNGFKYSTRMVCTVGVSVAIIFQRNYKTHVERRQVVFSCQRFKAYFFGIITFIFIQHLLARCVLLKRDANGSLVIDNRRFFHIAMHFFFFLNLLVGLFGCIKRICKCALISVLLLGRVDRCLAPPGFERFDQGYSAYRAFLELEVSLSHPVVVTFCHLLTQSQTKKEYDEDVERGQTESDVGNDMRMGLQDLETTFDRITHIKARRVRNRWFVAYTLIRNKALQSRRHHHLDKEAGEGHFTEGC